MPVITRNQAKNSAIIIDLTQEFDVIELIKENQVESTDENLARQRQEFIQDWDNRLRLPLGSHTIINSEPFAAESTGYTPWPSSPDQTSSDIFIDTADEDVIVDSNHSLWECSSPCPTPWTPPQHDISSPWLNDSQQTESNWQQFGGSPLSSHSEPEIIEIRSNSPEIQSPSRADEREMSDLEFQQMIRSFIFCACDPQTCTFCRS